jgi:uncharacterized protein
MPYISLVTLAVSNLERSSRFYRKLGWKPSSVSGDAVTFFHGSTAALALFGGDDMARDANVPAPSHETTGVSLAMNVTTEQEVDELLSLAETAGGLVTRAARHTDWGGYSGYFTDPDRHLWEVAHNPFFPLRDDGGVDLPVA